MSDPRQTLQFNTLTNVYTRDYSAGGGLYPATTFTDPNQNRIIFIQEMNGYQEVSQAPQAEGELIVWFVEEYGEKIAYMRVAIDDNGLKWKDVSLYNYTVNGDTGIREQ